MRLREPLEVRSGVYMLGSEWVNFYLVREGSDAILIDGGYTRYSSQVTHLFERIGLQQDAVSAVFVTHHHVDHVGTAEFTRRRGASVVAGKRDSDKIRGRESSRPPEGFFSQSWRPTMVRYLCHTTLAGGASYNPVAQVQIAEAEQTFDLPGRPTIVPTPGHTHGHFSVHMPEAGVLFTGDALVNFDYATGERGPKLHRFNEDRATASTSLDVLASLDAELLLFGHGDPWTSGTDSAIHHARARAAAGA